MFILKNPNILHLALREMGEFVGSKISLESISTILLRKMCSSRMDIVKSPRCAERCFTYLFYSLEHNLSLKNVSLLAVTISMGSKILGNPVLLLKYRENLEIGAPAF